jgi:hypothetical protein
MIKEIKKVQDTIETMELNGIEGVDEEAYTLYRDDPASATEFLNHYCSENAIKVLGIWRDLAAYLIARHAPSSQFAIETPESWKNLLLKVKEDLGKE